MMVSTLDQSLFYHQRTLKEVPDCVYVVKQAGLEHGHPTWAGVSLLSDLTASRTS